MEVVALDASKLEVSLMRELDRSATGLDSFRWGALTA